jgi:hypothetical protein
MSPLVWNMDLVAIKVLNYLNWHCYGPCSQILRSCDQSDSITLSFLLHNFGSCGGQHPTMELQLPCKMSSKLYITSFLGLLHNFGSCCNQESAMEPHLAIQCESNKIDRSIKMFSKFNDHQQE